MKISRFRGGVKKNGEIKMHKKSIFSQKS